MARILLFSLVLTVLGCSSQSTEAQSRDQQAIPKSKSVDAIQPEFSIDYIQGRFDPSSHPDFVEIDSTYADRAGMLLRSDTYNAFLQMYRAALADGITLQIRSATRNFDYQKGIWERKWTGKTLIENGKDASEVYPDSTERALAILRFSSMPGTSRHHWGTDIDLNAFENSWFETGEGRALYEWLVTHASAYGFCQPYTEKGTERPSGYEEEKWHWSYIPIAATLTELAQNHLKDSMIRGFQGSSTAPAIHVVEKYVLGINPGCLSQ